MNLLITGAWNCSSDEINSIKQLGYDTVFLQQEMDQLNCDYSWPEVIICNGLFLYHPIEKFTSLKLIQTTSSGLDRIPLDYCKENKIEVKNAKDVYSIPMAEFVVSSILDIYKKKKLFFKQQDERVWSKQRDLLELNNKTVLILGCGSVGKECAKRLKPFECIVYGVDINVFDNQCFDNIYPFEQLYELLNISDIVIIALPLTDKTKALFNKETFRLMKNKSVLINVSRGQIVDEEAIIDALNNKLLGAALDVFEEEPLSPKSKLWDIDNVIISPHNSFVGDNNDGRLFYLIKETLWNQNHKY